MSDIDEDDGMDYATNVNGLLGSMSVLMDKVEMIPLAALDGGEIDLNQLIQANDIALRGLVGHVSRLTVVVMQMAEIVDKLEDRK